MSIGTSVHPEAGQYYRRLLALALVHWKMFAISIIGMILVAGTDTAIAAYMKPLMDDGFVDRDPETIRLLPLVLIAIFVVRVFAMFISMYCISWVGRKVIMVLRQRMFSKLLLLPKDFYDSATSGEIISKFTFDVEQVANAATKAITIVIRDTFTVIGILTWMFYLSVSLTLVLLTTAPLIAILISFVTKKFRKLSKRIQSSIGDVSRIVEESIKAQIVVKVFGGRVYEESQFEKINDQNRRQNMRMIATQALSTPTIRLIVGIGLAAIIFLVTRDDAMSIVTPGTFASYMVSLTFLFGPVKRLADVNVDLQRGIAAAESVFKLTDLVDERDDGDYATERVRGDIVFSHVHFRYHGAKDDALTNINIGIHAGETVAFVGRSGSGKSTLLNLLPRLYDVSAGTITLDGRDVRDYKLDNLRSHLAFVGQDVVLFNDTVAHNIAYGSMRDASMEQIKRAAESAYADKFINELKQGYQTIVGERGLMLSGGQRQRIAIARALLANAPILILDEATSALDTESERFIQTSLDELMKLRTTLVIAHRLSTIENADRIVVLDDGKIVESGTHQQLLDNNGHYAALYQLQFASQD
ncbi:MAG: lipid A export permease/ATP-binding protein MsbA [Gammaproteobacteria bacterium]|nr:lipid A export permease/ATP-binding protein MsbA [Gammaproteobacteria bacterium]